MEEIPNTVLPNNVTYRNNINKMQVSFTADKGVTELPFIYLIRSV